MLQNLETRFLGALADQPKRDILDDLFSREAQDWVQESKREASPEPLPLVTSGGTRRTTETVTGSGDKPKGKKHHHLFGREASPEPLPLGVAAVSSHKISESRTDSGDKPKGKKHHHLFRREASPEPLPLGVAAVASHKISESRTSSGDKPKGKKHHHLFGREASPGW